MTDRIPTTSAAQSPKTALATLRAAGIACALVLGHGCSRDEVAPGPAFTACRLKGVEIALRCTNIVVPENRVANDPQGRRISLFVAVIPALARKPEADAIFVLAGGPGQAASDVAGPVHALFSKLNRDRDIVLVDQRGTGRSNRLSCAIETSSDDIDELDTRDLDDRIARCAKRLSERADLTRYTTSIAMADLDHVRERLGYRQIDLWGASYGTRAALEYVRQFPQHARTMTLDGVAPAWQKLPISFGVDTYATMRALVDSCARDAECAKRYPALAADLDGLFTALGTGGKATSIANPVTGAKRRTVVTRAGLAQLLRSPLYLSLTASLLPAAVDQAAHGDYDALAALSSTVGNGLEEQIALGMHLSILCAEDVPAITDDERAAARTGSVRSAVDGRPNPFAAVYEEQYRRLCARWPAVPVAPAYYGTLTGPAANVPTLLLSGGLDPATPPIHATSVERTLSRVAHVIAPNVGHGVSMQGCAPDLIERFVRSADPASVDGRCLASIPRPPFVVPIVEGRRDGEKMAVP